jgi:hypothetical protein
LKLIFKDPCFGSKTEQEEDSSMEFERGLRKWAVLKVGSLSPAGEVMKSSLTSMIVSSDDC